MPTDIDELFARFAARSIPVAIQEGIEENNFQRDLVIQFPKGSSTQEVAIGESDVDLIGEAPIEAYAYLENLDAIWSAELHSVECRLTLAGTRMSWEFALLHHMTTLPSVHPEPSASGRPGLPTITLPTPDPAFVCTIQPASEVHQLLGGLRIQGSRLMMNDRMGTSLVTLRIVGPAIVDHNSALRTLESLGYALLFDLDRAFDVPIFVAPGPDNIRVVGYFGVKQGPAPPSPPRLAYNAQALALYWAGRNADSSIMQYLSFYQVFEFFFPHFALREAVHRARDVLGAPAFAATRDEDMEGLVKAIKWPKNERAALRQVLSSGVGSEGLREFLDETQERAAFFGSREAARLSPCVIASTQRGQALCDQVSRRVYALRCRIVHTKQTGAHFPPLLPFSPEIDLLSHDLEFVSFAARRVLLATGSALSVTP